MIVIVHGYEGSGPGHWQRWLAAELERRGAAVVLPDLPEPLAPERDAWVAALAETVAVGRDADPAGDRRVTFVCHSLGCWALDHLLAAQPLEDAHAALLVAPPSPFLVFEPVESFLPPPRRRDAWAAIADRTLLVGSDDDDYTAPDEFATIARDLGVSSLLLSGAGHINVASGHGPWPFALEWLQSVGAIA